MPGDNDARLPLRMPAHLHVQLRYLSKATKLSMNDIILSAAMDKVEALMETNEVRELVEELLEEERSSAFKPFERSELPTATKGHGPNLQAKRDAKEAAAAEAEKTAAKTKPKTPKKRAPARRRRKTTATT